MKVAIIYNKDFNGVINKFGMQNREVYDTETINRVYEALEYGGHNVTIIDGNMYAIEQLKEFMPKVMEGEKMGMVFNMAYGIQGESRYTHIPALLEMLGIPYVGSSPAGHALALDKIVAKTIMQKHGIPTPEFWTFSSEYQDLSQVKYPCIVKPKMESVSFGLKVVYNDDKLKEAIRFITKKYNQQALVEKFIPGREFCVALLGNEPIEAFPVLEIDLGNNPNAIQTFEDKKNSSKRKICPANIPDKIATEMVHLSKKAFKALQLRDYARVDIRLDANNNIYVLEINSMASLCNSGSFVQAAKANGYTFNKLINKMLEVAVKRYFLKTFSNSNSFEDKEERLPIEIRSYLRSRQDNFEYMLQEMVNINTYVKNIEGVNKLGTIIKNYLSSLGFKGKFIKQVDVGNFIHFSNSKTGEYDVLLLGHLDDTVPLPQHRYYSKNGQRLYGTGIWKYKSGIVMMLAAIEALKHTGNLEKLRIGVLLTTDNSVQGKFSQNIIKKLSKKVKNVIGLSGSTPTGGIITSRAGSAEYHCQMRLTNPEGEDDIPQAVNIFTKLINDWTALTDKSNGLILSPSCVNITTNIEELKAYGELLLKVKFNDITQIENLDKKIKKSIRGNLKDNLYFEIYGGIKRPSMEYLENTKPLVKMIKDIAKKMDIILIEKHSWNSSNICFVDKNIPQIDGLGPIGIKMENNSEYILKHSLIEKAALLAVILYRLGNK
ncbi:M20/M25/M40 family metallo-hydrolase [Thermohalobacter berrensis]|uniref:ATP-grasp domain-containing protein n=1 Tax=Thermohalobacter berrensis TaxID=99594 RepID=A0A419SV76_9FIRM|nr:M20/M25/M40 family metallo-hydrolase [Thermohalobacter berrensis]RKD29132.1 hypothetical protein BET03_06185 [Thermohalobacter berrensis]